MTYCANKLKLSRQEYLDYVGSPDYSVRSFGADLGEGVRQSLVKFIQGGAKLRVSSRPSEQLKKLSAIKFFKKRDVVRLLRLSIFLNDERIVINPFDEPETDRDMVVASTERSLPRSAPLGASAQTQEEVKPEFQSVPVRQISQYLNHSVRLKRKGNKSRVNGYLTSVDKGVLSVEINRYGGVMAYEVPINQISEALVYK